MSHIPVANELWSDIAAKEDKPTVVVHTEVPPEPLILEGLTPDDLRKIEQLPEQQRIMVVLDELPRDTPPTRALYRDALNTGKEFELVGRVLSTGTLWCLGLGFAAMDLDLGPLAPRDQVQVIKSIRPGTKLLNLALHAPNQQVSDAIDRCLRGATKLEIVYREGAVSCSPCVDAATILSVGFKIRDGRRVLLTAEKPLETPRALLFGRVQFSSALERQAASFAPHVTHLVLIDCGISKPIVDLHFQHLTKLHYEIPHAWEGWAVARDLQSLRELRLDVPDENYPAPVAFPQVCRLHVDKVPDAGPGLWRWIGASFPNIDVLCLVPDDSPSVAMAIDPTRGGLALLRGMVTAIPPEPGFHAAIAEFAPNLEEISVPADVYPLWQ